MKKRLGYLGCGETDPSIADLYSKGSNYAPQCGRRIPIDEDDSQNKDADIPILDLRQDQPMTPQEIFLLVAVVDPEVYRQLSGL